ncbi:MAG: iron uptake transporter permease EfeU [Actinomycetota bacterium]
MIANLLIGLREGLEAALVVAILAAYLVRSGQQEQRRWLWFGTIAAIAASLGVGAVLTFTSRAMTFRDQELFGGFASLLAVGLVTWMVFWMRRAARGIATELRGRADRALKSGGQALAVVGFVAVGREGLETALFLWSATRNSGSTAVPLIGGFTGLMIATVCGWLFYRGALRLNLTRFFRWSGVALVIVAGGVLAYGIHDLQEAALLPGLTSTAYDVQGAIPPDSWYAVLLKGTVGFTPNPSWLEVVGWLAYVPLTLALFLRPVRDDAAAAPQPTGSQPAVKFDHDPAPEQQTAAVITARSSTT